LFFSEELNFLYYILHVLLNLKLSLKFSEEREAPSFELNLCAVLMYCRNDTYTFIQI